MTIGGCLLQRRNIPHSIIPPILPLFDILLVFFTRERVCTHVFSRVLPPLFQLVFFLVIFGVLLKYPLPPRMFRKKPAMLPPLAVISAIDALDLPDRIRW